MKLGQPEKAKENYQHSLLLAQKFGNQKAIGNALQSLGNLYLKEKNHTQALAYLYQAKEVLEATGEKTEYLRLLDNLSAAYAAAGDLNTALRYAKDCYDLSSEQGQLYYIQQSSAALSGLYERQGAVKKALDYLKITKEVSDSLAIANNREENVRLEEKYKYQKQQDQVEASFHLALDRKQKILYTAIASIIVLCVVVLLLAQNIRERNRHNAHLRDKNRLIEQQKQKLEQSDQFKNHLISMLGHDIRPPIENLKLLMPLLQDDALSPAKRKQFIATYEPHLDAIVYFLDNLLLWAISQSKEPNVRESEFQLSGLVSRIYDIYSGIANQKNITLNMDIAPSLRVRGDKEMLNTVFRNLVHNGLKYCQEGDQITVEARSEESAAKVRIYVHDTGPGLPESIQKALFAGEDAALSTLTHNRGTGLGLLLCHHYLQLNGSKLHLDSSEGTRGTRFWFELPLCPEEAQTP